MQVYAEVPRSAKEDADNTGNVERRKAGKKSDYWNECGVWSRDNGHITLTAYYVHSGTILSVVKMQNGKCARHRW